MFYCSTCKRDKPDKDKIKINRYRIVCRDCFVKMPEATKARIAFKNWKDGLEDE